MSLVPTDPAQVSEITEVAKTLRSALEAASGFGKYMADVAGDIPHDLVGIVGDRLKIYRMVQAHKAAQKAYEGLRTRGIDPIEEPSPSIVLPILEGAVNEGREELADLWAKLLEASIDPSRANKVRREFIEIVKSMEPLDARVLPLVQSQAQGTMRDVFASRLKVNPDEIEVSFFHLIDLKVAANAYSEANPTAIANIYVSPRGRELARLLNI